MSEKQTRHQKKKKRTGLKVFLGIVLVFLVAVGLYIANVYRNVNSTTKEIYEPIALEEVNPFRPGQVDLSREEPISILLLGIDTGDLGRTERGRSDSMIVATINPNTEKTVLTSIPRDTYTEIVGYGTMDKLNHAYAFGGTSMAINSVQNLLDIPIDYYVSVNMAGIKEIVDAVGGIDVESPLTFTQDGYDYYQGEVTHMDGESALAFSRMRYQDPENDIGRQSRQRLVIEGVIKKAVSASTLLNYQEILGTLSNNVQTNFQMKDYLALQGNRYMKAARNIESQQIGGTGEIAEDGIYYHYIPEEELTRVQGLLDQELEID